MCLAITDEDRALSLANNRGEANTVTELARAFPVDASVMSREVSKLVDRGLISRKRRSLDRRTGRLSLTMDGRSLVQQLAEELSERQGLLMKGVSDDERAAFTATAHMILANLEDTASTPPPPRFWGREIGPAIRFTDCGVMDERIGNG